MLHRLSTTGIDHRRVGVLWQREVRNLPADDQHELRDELRSAAGRVADAVRAARPELDDAEADTLAWCALGALVSIGFHNLELPRPEFDDLLFDIMLRIVSTELPDAVRSSASAEQIASDSLPRRDQLITVATQLFADRGFAATGIDDIGDAAGIAGPSVYNHFASKQAILAAAIDRAERILNGELETVLSSASTSEHKIGELVGSYVRRANTDRFVLRTLLSELGELAPADRQLARQAQRRYIDSWVDLLQKFGSEDPVTARIRVQAVLLLVNDAVQTPHLRSQAGFEETLVVVAENVLGAAGSV
jgi:AcrR family transcriptional regulator